MSVLSTLRTVLTPRRLALAAAPLMLAGAAVPMLGAGPVSFSVDFGRDHDRDHRGADRRTEIIVRAEPSFRQPVRIIPVQVAPYDLRISAYQARGGGAIMVFVTGSNRTAGYTTTIAADDCRGREPLLTLTNISPIGICSQVITPFSINAAIRADREVRSITVQAAGQAISVPVICVQTIS